MNQLVPFRSGAASPALVAAAGGRAQERFIEFFTANIRNRNTRRAGRVHVVKRGKTPVLAPEEALRMLDVIDVSTHAGLRDRALIGLMVFSFARIGAALAMKAEDVFVQDRRLWVRLSEKGGKRHEMPATTILRPTCTRWTTDRCCPICVRHPSQPSRPPRDAPIGLSSEAIEKLMNCQSRRNLLI